MTIFTRHREKLQKEKHQEDVPERHSCICAHCGRQFPSDSDTFVDTDVAESEDNS
jgi:hypothetical protein